MARPEYGTIDDYIATCEPKIQEILQEMRQFIQQHAPGATEKISWAMPTFYLKGNLVHFMAHSKHIGFYPGSSGIEHFAAEFDEAGYKYSKGAVQFPLNKPMPYELIGRIVDFRVTENTSEKI